jgi:hypothetical protein
VRRALLLVAGVVLLLPAAASAAPPNDDRAKAASLGELPTVVKGTTVGASVDPSDPTACGPIDASVWYRLDRPEAGTTVLQLKAAGDLDALVGVFQRVRSELRLVQCARTNDKGVAKLSFGADKGASYLILVGQRRGSASAAFTLTAFLAQPPPTPPGVPLAPNGVRDSVDAFGNTEDAWAIDMTAGTTYRFNLVSYTGACLSLQLFAPGTKDFTDNDQYIASLDCEGYGTFTPGPDGGGRYSVVIYGDRESQDRQTYRLQVAKAGVDDTSPGIPLANRHAVTGHLAGLGIDVVDLYRFDVTSRSDVTLKLADGPNARFNLYLLSDRGRRLDCACGDTGTTKLTKRLEPGRYFAVARARPHSGGRYRLSLLIREITSTSFSISSGEISPGSTVDLAAHVSTGLTGGRVEIQVDRFDPLEGWVFYKLFEVPVSGGSAVQSWRPPSVGRWRARGSFLGTGTASPSRSGYAYLLVARPLGTP